MQRSPRAVLPGADHDTSLPWSPWHSSTASQQRKTKREYKNILFCFFTCTFRLHRIHTYVEAIGISWTALHNSPMQQGKNQRKENESTKRSGDLPTQRIVAIHSTHSSGN